MTPLQKLPKNVGDLGTLIGAKGFKTCPKSNKSPILVTLSVAHVMKQLWIKGQTVDTLFN